MPEAPGSQVRLDAKTYSADYDYEITTPSGRKVNAPERGRPGDLAKKKFEEMVSR